jgi:DNA-binding NarL/FixJ family response regulator
MTHSQHRVLVVSRNPLFAQGIVSLLQGRSDIVVVGNVRGVGRSASALDCYHADTVVVDYALSNAVQKIAHRLPRARVIAVTLGDNTLDIYDTTHIDLAGPNDLLAAVESSVIQVEEPVT